MKIGKYLRALKTRMVKDPLPPKAVAAGWALGMFIGCVVPFGLQLIVSVPLSLKLRWSKVGATLGTLVTNPATIWFIYPAQTWVALWLMGRPLSWATLSEKCLRLAEVSPLDVESWRILGELGRDLLAGYFLGGFLLALLLTPLTYLIVLRLVTRYRRLRRQAREGRK